MLHSPCKPARRRVLLATLAAAGLALGLAAAPANTATPTAPADEFASAGFDFAIEAGPYQPTVLSLGTHTTCPEWFRDAKFGIYMHWGLNSVSGFDGHYARFMYTQNPPAEYLAAKQAGRPPRSGYKPGRERVYESHVRRFGHPSKFGYKDFIPLWKADRFDAPSLAALYREAGAKFIGVMAVHCDAFDLYDSTHQPWNSVRMGPKIDIVAAWRAACQATGLRFAITSHLSNQTHEHLFYQGIADTTGPLKDVPYDVMDPANEGLYGARTPDRLRRINPAFAQNWYRRSKELIDKYQPDLFYLDGDLPNGDYGLNLAAHFYNTDLKRHGQPLGVFTIKRPRPGFTLDIEAAGADRLMPEPFLVDTSLNPGWFYLGSSIGEEKEGGDAGMTRVASSAKGADKVRLTAGQVVDNLVDIVSKNGNMMLNLGLRPDGSLPETFRLELLDIGRWLRTNGEAIYGTRPFTVFGEGPFKKPAVPGVPFDDHLYAFSARDIRFTTKPGVVYAILLDWPGDGAEVAIQSLGRPALGVPQAVSLLVTGAQLPWRQDETGLHVTLPARPPGDFAYVLKVRTAAQP